MNNDFSISVADFGFAKIRYHTSTMTGTKGTPFYMVSMT